MKKLKPLGKHHPLNNQRADGKQVCGNCQHFDPILEVCTVRFMIEDDKGNILPADNFLPISRKASFVRCRKFKLIN